MDVSVVNLLSNALEESLAIIGFDGLVLAPTHDFASTLNDFLQNRLGADGESSWSIYLLR